MPWVPKSAAGDTNAGIASNPPGGIAAGPNWEIQALDCHSREVGSGGVGWGWGSTLTHNYGGLRRGGGEPSNSATS